MKTILRFLKPLLRLNYRHPYLVLSFALILAIISGFYAFKLKVDTDIANLLPEDYKSVQALEQLKETVGGETPLKVAIKSPSFESNLKFARDLIGRAANLEDPSRNQKYFDRISFEKETEVLKENALYLATSDELKDITEYLESEIEKAKLEANPFYFDVESDTQDTVSEERLKEFEESYNALVPRELPVNEDSTIMVVEFYPTGSKSDLGFLRDMFAASDSMVASMNPTQYHSDMEVLVGGRLERHLMQLDSIMKDVLTSFGSGITSVLLLVMLYFFFKKYFNYTIGTGKGRRRSLWRHVKRLPIPILIIGIPLLISLAWTFGITYWYLGRLNTMTSVLFVILFGLGIDYGIHFYARYIEIRSSGKSIWESLEQTYENTGVAIVISAATTAAALYVLLFADFRGFYEFGFISGNGILLTLLTMMFVMPALLVVFERFHWILIYDKDPNRYQKANDGRKPRFPYARTITVSGIVVAMLVIAFSPYFLKFQYKFGELEPDFEEYDNFRDLAGQVEQDSKRNPAYIIAETDEQVLNILDELRQIKKQDTLSPTIAEVEALQERYPTQDTTIQKKLKKISEIRELLNDPFLKDQKDEQLDKLREASQTEEPLEISEIPEFLRERFTTKNGELGRFVMIYPSVGLSDGRKSIAFMEDVGVITTDDGNVYHAASTSIIAAEMLELIRMESPYMVAGTFVIIFLFMYFSFRSLRWTLIGLLPLVVGLLWTFGIMMVFNIQFNFYNIIVLPAILGIGEDNGVHLAHRYRSEGKGSMWTVLTSTGQHITIGSFTTMLGFAGLLFTHHPGLQSIGILAVVGIGMTLFSALTFLPALIQFLEDRNWIKFDEDMLTQAENDGGYSRNGESVKPVKDAVSDISSSAKSN